MSYSYYNPYPQPFQDQLSQLRNQYNQMFPPTPPQQNNAGLLWVQGEAGAKSYLVAPNATVLLMDSEAQRFYLKSTDAAGMPTMKTFEYKEVTAMPKAESSYTEPQVSYREFLQLKEAVTRLEQAQQTVSAPAGEIGGVVNE